MKFSSENYNLLLKNISDELDIPISKYLLAVNRYETIGRLLNEEEYENNLKKPSIYTQGSFRLGTVVRPIKNGIESDYDIDIVCQFGVDKNIYSPEYIKKVVGDCLKKNQLYIKMLDDEGRRCWTINYAEQDGVGFHIDILPSVNESIELINNIKHTGVENDVANTAIAITNKNNSEYNWESSNPIGYGNWFDIIQQPVFSKIQKREKAWLFENNKNIFAKVEDVPDKIVKTPLQRVVQILKRHRDICFSENEIGDKDKPISIIITTLCAKLYQNEEDVYTTLKNIVEKISRYNFLIENYKQADINLIGDIITRRDDGTWYFPNPVNPLENFADKWHENNNKKARTFFKWVEFLRRDLLDILRFDTKNHTEILEKSLGKELVKRALSNIDESKPIDKVEPISNKVHLNEPPKPWKNV